MKQAFLSHSHRYIVGLLPLLEALEKKGIEPESFLSQWGISLDTMTSTTLIEQQLELDIWAACVDILDDPLLGLKTWMTFSSYGSYAMLLMTAPTLLDTCRLATQFQPLNLLFTHMSLHMDKDYCELRYTLPGMSDKLRYLIADRDFIGTYMFIKQVLDDPINQVDACGIARPRPDRKLLTEYHRHFEIEPAFSQSYNWFRIPTAVLRPKGRHANSLAHKLYRREAYELLHKLNDGPMDLVTQIRQILQGYEGQLPSAPEIARFLGVSERTLRRKLDSAGVKYRELIEEQRKHLALDMIGSKQATLKEVSEQLGYSDPVSLMRAFKRWTGLTPKQFLQQ